MLSGMAFLLAGTAANQHKGRRYKGGHSESLQSSLFGLVAKTESSTTYSGGLDRNLPLTKP